MSWKVLVTAWPFDASSDNGKRMLKEAGCEVVMTTPSMPLSHDSLRRELPGVDAIIAGSDDYSEATLSLAEAKLLSLLPAGALATTLLISKPQPGWGLWWGSCRVFLIM